MTKHEFKLAKIGLVYGWTLGQYLLAVKFSDKGEESIDSVLKYVEKITPKKVSTILK